MYVYYTRAHYMYYSIDTVIIIIIIIYSVLSFVDNEYIFVLRLGWSIDVRQPPILGDNMSIVYLVTSYSIQGYSMYLIESCIYTYLL